MAGDLAAERRATVPFPPGWTRFSMRRTTAFARHPLPLLLEAYERFGPVFTVRVFHGNVVVMLGPEANHYMTVSHAANFSWREGHLGDMMPLLGDGLLTIDGEFHRRSRKIMLPAFHRDQIAKTQAGATATSWTSTRGRACWHCGSRCGRCSAWTPIAAATSAPRTTSSRRWASGPRTTCCRCCAVRARRGRSC
jgi:hypothetical protein